MNNRKCRASGKHFSPSPRQLLFIVPFLSFLFFVGCLNDYDITPKWDKSQISVTPASAEEHKGKPVKFDVYSLTLRNVSRTVGGKCPLGTWAGATYTIIVGESDCEVTFSLSPDIALGNSISFSEVTRTSMKVSWGAASHPDTAANALVYKLVQASSAAAIDTVDEANAVSGASLVMDWTAGATSKAVSSLTANTTYFYNVLVRDPYGQVQMYGAQSKTTLADSAPTAGTGISFSNVAYTALTVNWGAATDSESAQSSLEYKLVQASSAAAIDTVDEVNAISGSALVMDWTANTTSKAVSSLVENTTYFYNVLVRDSAANMVIYGVSSLKTPTTPPATNLMAHWKFDNSLVDASGNGKTGTAQGTLTYSTTVVKFGTHSAVFNGTDTWVSTAVSFNGVTAFTSAGWVYLTGVSNDRLGFWGQNDLIEMGIITASNRFTCLWVAGSNTACDSSALPLNQWSHVAVTGSTSTGTAIFVNGTSVATNSNISGSTSSYLFNIGHGVFDPSSDSTKPFLAGYIDELAIWNRVLSSTEIQSLANQ